MDNNGIYALTKKSDEERIDYVVEKLHNEKDKVTEISWEKFTTDYMKYPLPNGDELMRNKWVDLRASWVAAINERFIDVRYPYHLEVVWGIGVELLSDNHAAIKKVVKKVKRQATATVKTTTECRRLAESKIYPKMNRLFSSIDNTMRNCMMMVWGEIDQDPKLPKNKKEELKKALRSGLPPSENLLLPFGED